MEFVRARINVSSPSKGDNATSEFESMYPDLQIESGGTKDGGFISFTMFNSKDGTKTPVGELSNIVRKDSRSVKISMFDLQSLYLIRSHIEVAIALAEKNRKEAALKAASN